MAALMVSAPSCSDSSNSSQLESKSHELKSLQDARAELQARVDRFLGGQKIPDSRWLGDYLPIQQISTKIETLSITGLVLAYGDDGTPRRNVFKATLAFTGAGYTSRAPESGTFQIEWRYISERRTWEAVWLPK